MSLVLVLLLTAAPEPIPTGTLIGFSEAVERALAHNPAMRVAEQDAARAMAQLEQARAPSLPLLNANANLTRLDNDRIIPGSVAADGTVTNDRLVAGKDQLSANLQAIVPLVNTPRWAQWYRSSKAADAARATANDVRRQVAVGAARAWLAVLAQRRTVQAATSARDAAKAHLDYAHERYVGGVGTRLDELRAAQELNVSTTQLETSLGALIRAQEALGVFCGADEPLDTLSEEPDFAPPGGINEALATVEVARLDVKAAQVRKDSAASGSHVDWMDYVPMLNAIFQPFYQNPPSINQPLTGWQFNLVLAIPLYDGGLRYGQAKERRANSKSADAQLEASLRQAKSEVRAAFKQVTHADAAMQAARESAKQATEALELANVAYHAGATTNLEVIDAERRARDAKLQAVLSEDQSRQARLDLLSASGNFPSP